MAKTAAQMQERYKAGIANSRKSYVDGVRGTTKDPIALAKAAKDKWWQKLTEANANNAFEEGLNGSNKAIWQANSEAAADKLAAAAPNAATKYGKYAQLAAPMQANFQQEVQSMPNITEADADARMLRNVALQRQLKGITRGRR